MTMILGALEGKRLDLAGMAWSGVLEREFNQEAGTLAHPFAFHPDSSLQDAGG